LASEDASKLIAEGNRLWSENKVEDAEVSFKKAIEADPDSPEAYGRLGALLMVQNRGDDAIAAYQEAITRDSENAKYFAALSIAYLHKGYHAMAKEMVERAIELDPNMKNAKDITKYIDAKMERMAEASSAQEHKNGNDPHANVVPAPAGDK
ncbi:tetratricopeptide repeat protein, partial [Solemya velum gill symbiont]|uniref:tetratricopeptide repeat protein n=1 Tax=Solemya velum gill symbiont TaxID=2340 RepID=UPI0009C42AC3